MEPPGIGGRKKEKERLQSQIHQRIKKVVSSAKEQQTEGRCSGNRQFAKGNRFFADNTETRLGPECLRRLWNQ